MKKSNVIKKVVLVLLILAMGTTLLCGCKTTGKGDTSVPTLKWYMIGEKQPDVDTVNEEISKITSKKIGANVELCFIEPGAYTDKMSMINAASEPYDLCYVGYVNTYKQNIKNGSLLELTDLLKQVPALTESLPDFVIDSAMIDGEIYAIPNYQIMATTAGLSINKELADKYNFDPSTIKKTTDIEPFLEAVAKNEPNMYGFRTNWGIDAFGDVESDPSRIPSTITRREIRDGKRVCVANYDKQRELAEILYDWYKKGYIRPDNASVMDDSQEARAGKYAVMSTVYKPGVEAEDFTNMGAHVYSVSVSNPVLTADVAWQTMTGISANSKHPEKAIKLMELANTDKELYNMLSFGVEGKHYNMVGENRIELIEGSGYNPNASWAFGNQFNAYLLPGQSDDVWEKTKQINESAVKDDFYGFQFDKSSVKTISAQIETVKSEYKIMRSGALNPDEYFDEYIRKLKDAGLDEYIAEYQRQLDEFFKQ